VFEPFNRLGREASAIEGTGVGLAMARKLLHLMNGNIDFSSRSGEGSRFWIDIPAYILGDKANVGCGIDHQLPSDEIVQSTGDGIHTVRCVDDNVSGLALVSAIIERCPGVGLLTAETAELGIALARERRPDLILMDINLPGMSGIAALTELRRHDETRDIPVYALSAAASAPEIERGLAAGFIRYLTKPLDVREFTNVITVALTKRKGEHVEQLPDTRTESGAKLAVSASSVQERHPG
jgi:CheY-like chemotaxis protein